jgi:hypothetical protein
MDFPKKILEILASARSCIHTISYPADTFDEWLSSKKHDKSEDEKAAQVGTINSFKCFSEASDIGETENFVLFKAKKEIAEYISKAANEMSVTKSQSDIDKEAYEYILKFGEEIDKNYAYPHKTEKKSR